MNKTHDAMTGSQCLGVGALAGLVATLPMTAVMVGLHHLLPKREQYPLTPREITEIEGGRLGFIQHMDEKQRQVATMVAHFGYGSAAGAAYAPWATHLPVAPALSGLLYGLVVWAGSYLGLLPALGILTPASKHPARRNALMIVAHLVWGAVLGVLVQRFERHHA